MGKSNVAALKEAMQAYDALRLKLRSLCRCQRKKSSIDYDRAFQTVDLAAVDPLVKQEQINQALAELSRAGRKIKRESN